MKQLIEALEGLLVASSISGGDASEAVNFALEHIDWKAKLVMPDPQSQPVVDGQLEVACENSGQYGSNPHMIAEAVMAVKDELRWGDAFKDRGDEPDLAAFSLNYAWSWIIGNGGILHSDKVALGLSLQGRDSYYPPHAHQAIETYWIAGGDGDWKVGIDPWFPVEAGDTIFHETGVRHAMQTNANPMLAVWLWTSHLDSELVIVRG